MQSSSEKCTKWYGNGTKMANSGPKTLFFGPSGPRGPKGMVEVEQMVDQSKTCLWYLPLMQNSSEKCTQWWWKWPLFEAKKKSFLAPNGQIWGHFRTTGCIFLTSFALRVLPPHVSHCDPPFDPLLPVIWGVWSLLWPKNGIFGPKWATLEPFPHHWVHFSDKFCT